MRKMILAFLIIPFIGYGQTPKEKLGYQKLSDSLDQHLIDSFSRVKGVIIIKGQNSTTIIYSDEHGRSTNLVLVSQPIYFDRKKIGITIELIQAEHKIITSNSN